MVGGAAHRPGRARARSAGWRPWAGHLRRRAPRAAGGGEAARVGCRDTRRPVQGRRGPSAPQVGRSVVASVVISVPGCRPRRRGRIGRAARRPRGRGRASTVVPCDGCRGAPTGAGTHRTGSQRAAPGRRFSSALAGCGFDGAPVVLGGRRPCLARRPGTLCRTGQLPASPVTRSPMAFVALAQRTIPAGDVSGRAETRHHSP